MLHCLATGFDEGDEAERRPLAVTRARRRPRRELADREPQEVEPGPAPHLVEGVADPGLARLQFQPHVPQPFGDDLLGLPYHALLRVEYDEVVRIADQGG